MACAYCCYVIARAFEEDVSVNMTDSSLKEKTTGMPLYLGAPWKDGGPVIIRGRQFPVRTATVINGTEYCIEHANLLPYFINHVALTNYMIKEVKDLFNKDDIV